MFHRHKHIDIYYDNDESNFFFLSSLCLFLFPNIFYSDIEAETILYIFWPFTYPFSFWTRAYFACKRENFCQILFVQFCVIIWCKCVWKQLRVCWCLCWYILCVYSCWWKIQEKSDCKISAEIEWNEERTSHFNLNFI